MDKMSYTDFIKCYQNDDTIKTVGTIDVEFLKSNKVESLYYSFPLIERMVLEIYKLVPETDVEHLDQGVMKTIMSIIEGNREYNILPIYIIKIIEKYFGDTGERNKLFHIREETINIEVSFREINFLIMKLLKILKDKLNDIDKIEFRNVVHLK